MNTEVLFENKDNNLIITLNKNSNYEEIKNKIISILYASGDALFDGVAEPIIIKGKRLSDFEEEDLLSIFSKKTDKKIIIEKPKRLRSCNYQFNIQ